MLKRILIDASYSEEVRLVMTEEDVVKEIDYKSGIKKSLKGNVYLAKVSRVEPSLQAAFVEYGTEKQGFLPLSEIHPDYYQIPKDDKEELMEKINQEKRGNIDEDSAEDEGAEKKFDNFRFYKKYKIQEIIKKDQIILVQVAKEERGNKGASLTTYISLAGRYCVLMPNTHSNGGVSRKIENLEERTRLKDLVSELTKDDDKASMIFRTAGAYKTKTEIKRDLSYLRRLWENIKKHTLSSDAPTFIHEEGDVVKKAIRDMYNSDVEEIIVSGGEAFQDAKEFMKLLLPKHIDKIKLYDNKLPIFAKYGIDRQLANLYENDVLLDSGGAIVINQTEALVAIDVNSGRFTSESSIESTALKSNLNAAKEIAKQLKLRDLSGLIVIDFIDMTESQNRKAVEKALKEALSGDRARTQVGRISEFGLLEMSRQRIRSSFSEANLLKCESCRGIGKIRPVHSTAIALIRAIEREAHELGSEVSVSGSKELILYILNNMRDNLSKLEEKSVKVSFGIDESAGMDGFFIEKRKKTSQQPLKSPPALSSIDQEIYREEKESTKKKPRKKAPVNKKGDRQDVDNYQEEEEDVKASHRKKINKNREDKRKEKTPNKETSQPAAEKMDDENSSFLRDIWKKIMD